MNLLSNVKHSAVRIGKRCSRSTQKRYLQLSFAIAVSLCAAISAHAGDFKVIANPSVKTSTVSADDLKAVYLRVKNSLEDGSQVEPVIQKSGPAHEAFLKGCLAKSDTALNTYYRSLVFTGRGTMPKTVGSDEEVVKYVAATKGAIGYVSPGTAAPGTKTIELK